MFNIEIDICELLIQSGATIQEFKNPILKEHFNNPYSSEEFFKWFKDEPDMDCAICYEQPLANGQPVCINTTCPHGFHCGCINKWLGKGNQTCPLCRQDIINLRVLNPNEKTRLLELASGAGGGNGFGKRKKKIHKKMTIVEINKPLKELKSM